jgi:uncharacterized membrane protein (DUF2068 family)
MCLWQIQQPNNRHFALCYAMHTELKGLRIIATIEAFKGCVALCVAIGIQSLAGVNLQKFIAIAASHLHLNPAKYLPAHFLNTHEMLSAHQTMLIGLGAFAYASIRLIEAYGLWRGKRWTEWLALLSAAIYIPFEIRATLLPDALYSTIALAINVLVVVYIAYAMFHPKFRTARAPL